MPLLVLNLEEKALPRSKNKGHLSLFLMIRTIFYILYFVCIILYFLFVFPLYVGFTLSSSSFSVSIYALKIINKKGDKVIDFFKKFIPKNKDEISKSIDYGYLLNYVHIDEIILKRKVLVDDYLMNVYLSTFINIIDQITPKIKINIKQDKEEKIRLVLHFNVGIILLNYLSIRRKYFHGKKQNI